MRMLRSKSPVTIVTLGLVLALSGVALAAAGGSSLVVTGEDSAATSAGTQEPLGTLSATPPPEVEGEEATPPDVLGDNVAPPVRGGTEAVSDGEGAVAGAPAAGSGDGVRSLPFTGFVALPVLILGAALLAAGMVMRRRQVRATA
jgi:hypothetical protein